MFFFLSLSLESWGEKMTSLSGSVLMEWLGMFKPDKTLCWFQGQMSRVILPGPPSQHPMVCMHHKHWQTAECLTLRGQTPQWEGALAFVGKATLSFTRWSGKPGCQMGSTQELPNHFQFCWETTNGESLLLQGPSHTKRSQENLKNTSHFLKPQCFCPFRRHPIFQVPSGRCFPLPLSFHIHLFISQ